MQESSTEKSLLTERERQGIQKAAFNFILGEMQKDSGQKGKQETATAQQHETNKPF